MSYSLRSPVLVTMLLDPETFKEICSAESQFSEHARSTHQPDSSTESWEAGHGGTNGSPHSRGSKTESLSYQSELQASLTTEQGCLKRQQNLTSGSVLTV